MVLLRRHRRATVVLLLSLGVYFCGNTCFVAVQGSEENVPLSTTSSVSILRRSGNNDNIDNNNNNPPLGGDEEEAGEKKDKDATNNTNKNSERRRQTYFDELTCRLSLFEFHRTAEQRVYPNDQSSEAVYMCNPVRRIIPDSHSGELMTSDKEYAIPVADADLRVEHRHAMQDGLETYVTVTHCVIDEQKVHIRLTDRSQMRLSDQWHRTQARKLANTNGVLRALMVRIIMNDREPMYSRNELFRITFQEPVSLRTQYHACSFGKLRIEPTGLGAIEVRIDQYASSPQSDSRLAVNEATDVALAYVNAQTGQSYTSLTEYADLLMFVTPKMGDFLAYANVGGALSVYNDKWGGFLASQMHEIGHNLMLFHANEGDEYQDHTGYMGGAIIGYHDKVGFPKMCFNARNYWDLGWLDDRKIETDLYTQTLIRIAAFADYPKTTLGREYVLLRAGNVYVAYNRAKEINQDTYEYKDDLVLYQGMPDGSYLFSALQYPEQPLYYRILPQGEFYAEICDQIDGDGRTTPDYMVISIGFGGSLCSQYEKKEDRSRSNSGSLKSSKNNRKGIKSRSRSRRHKKRTR